MFNVSPTTTRSVFGWMASQISTPSPRATQLTSHRAPVFFRNRDDDPDAVIAAPCPKAWFGKPTLALIDEINRYIYEQDITVASSDEAARIDPHAKNRRYSASLIFPLYAIGALNAESWDWVTLDYEASESWREGEMEVVRVYFRTIYRDHYLLGLRAKATRQSSLRYRQKDHYSMPALLRADDLTNQNNEKTLLGRHVVSAVILERWRPAVKLKRRDGNELSHVRVHLENGTQAIGALPHALTHANVGDQVIFSASFFAKDGQQHYRYPRVSVESVAREKKHDEPIVRANVNLAYKAISKNQKHALGCK